MNNYQIIKRIADFFANSYAKIEKDLKLYNGYLGKVESGAVKDLTRLKMALINKGLNPDYFITGEGRPEKNSTERAEIDTSGDIAIVLKGLEDGGILIPFLNQKASAGSGAELGDTDISARVVLLPEKLKKYGKLHALEVSGDSMSPTLHDGDILICDGCKWAGDGIYVIKDNEYEYVKRIIRSTSGYQIISDNKQYPACFEDKEALCVVGKVRAAIILWD